MTKFLLIIVDLFIRILAALVLASVLVIVSPLIFEAFNNSFIIQIIYWMGSIFLINMVVGRSIIQND